MTVLELSVETQPRPDYTIKVPSKSTHQFAGKEVMLGYPDAQEGQLEGVEGPDPSFLKQLIQVLDRFAIKDDDVDDGNAAGLYALGVQKARFVADLQHNDVAAEDEVGEAESAAETVVEEVGDGQSPGAQPAQFVGVELELPHPYRRD